MEGRLGVFNAAAGVASLRSAGCKIEGMQRIQPCELTAEQYVATEAYRQIRAEPICPLCDHGPLHRHGTYERGITTEVGQVIRILIARFLCQACRRTVSYLPAFCLSYRLVQASTFEAFLEGRLDRRDVQTWEDLLRGYRRRMLGFARELARTVGCGFSRAPPAAAGLWPWLMETCGGLAGGAGRGGGPPHADW